MTQNGDLGTVAPCPLVKGSGGSCNLVQEIQLRTDDTERGSGDGSPIPPSQGFWRQL